MSFDPKPRFYYGWVVVAVSFITMAIVSPAWFSFSIFYPAILAEFGWSRGDTAVAFSINLVINAFGSPVVGFLIDRYGPRRVMPVGAFLLALGLLGASRVDSLWQFYFWFGLIAGLGICTVQVVPNTTVVSNWFVRNRATALGIIMGGIGIGRLALFPLIQYIISTFGWRTAYVALAGLIALFLAPVIIIFQRHRPADKGLQDHPEVCTPTEKGKLVIAPRREVVVIDQAWAAKEWTLKRAARTYRFWALAFMIVIYGAGLFLITVQLLAYLTASGFSSITGATVIALQGLMTTMGNFAGGTLSDRLGREKAVTLSIVIFVTGILCLSMLQTHPNSLVLYSYVICFGLGFGLGMPAIMAAAADLFQGEHFGTIFGAINMIGNIGGAIGAGLGGYLFDKTGSYPVLFAVTSAAIVFSIVFIWSAQPSKVRVVIHKSGLAPKLQADL